MIRLSGINKSFKKFRVLDQISLEFKAGQCIALIGPNGSGKTTLIKTILGMVIPDSGEMEINGKPVNLDIHYRKNIGYMPQITRYPENMTIAQVIDMIRDIRGQSIFTDEELIESFGLPSIQTKKMGTLSGGTRQKVGAALAFLFNPSILILDEPTAGLDPASSLILQKKIIKEMKQGKIVIISSHVLSELDEMVTDVVYMQEGKILFNQSLTYLKKITGENRLMAMVAKMTNTAQ